jgi:hypothetical protein
MLTLESTDSQSPYCVTWGNQNYTQGYGCGTVSRSINLWTTPIATTTTCTTCVPSQFLMYSVLTAVPVFTIPPNTLPTDWVTIVPTTPGGDVKVQPGLSGTPRGDAVAAGIFGGAVLTVLLAAGVVSLLARRPKYERVRSRT